MSDHKEEQSDDERSAKRARDGPTRNRSAHTARRDNEPTRGIEATKPEGYTNAQDTDGG